MYRAIVNLARSIGLEGVHPHSLRHFFGTQLAERGVRLEVIQDLMGHADPATTRVYVAVPGRSLREAGSALEAPTKPALLAEVPKDPNPRGDGLSEMGLDWELPRS